MPRRANLDCKVNLAECLRHRTWPRSVRHPLAASERKAAFLAQNSRLYTVSCTSGSYWNQHNTESFRSGQTPSAKPNSFRQSRGFPTGLDSLGHRTGRARKRSRSPSPVARSRHGQQEKIGMGETGYTYIYSWRHGRRLRPRGRAHGAPKGSSTRPPCARSHASRRTATPRRRMPKRPFTCAPNMERAGCAATAAPTAKAGT